MKLLLLDSSSTTRCELTSRVLTDSPKPNLFSLFAGATARASLFFLYADRDSVRFPDIFTEQGSRGDATKNRALRAPSVGAVPPLSYEPAKEGEKNGGKELES